MRPRRFCERRRVEPHVEAGGKHALRISRDHRLAAVQWGGIKKREDDEGDEDFALIEVTFKKGSKQREMRFGFERQPDKTWRISEIHYPDGTSLLQILRAAYPG